jgi:hypothetical protein
LLNFDEKILTLFLNFSYKNACFFNSLNNTLRI